MENMRDIQAERKRIRQRLDKAYSMHDEEEIIKTAKQLITFVEVVAKNKDG